MLRTLMELFQDCWKSISGDQLMKPTERTARVCKDVIEAKGLEELKYKTFCGFTLFCLLHDSIALCLQWSFTVSKTIQIKKKR